MIEGIRINAHGAYLTESGNFVEADDHSLIEQKFGLGNEDKYRINTMSYQILLAHNRSNDPNLMKLEVDSLVSPDNVYTSLIQTARASGIDEFKLPFVMTNCHNSLCSIGGTINEDDHNYGFSCAKRYGGIYVPTYQSVIHQYMREQMAFSGAMIMGSDSHTRYGALGTMGIGEGGGELVKQLVGQPYEVPNPKVIAVVLTGKLSHGVGPHDVSIALIGALFPSGFAKNKILEFIGPGVSSLSIDMRLGIDAMTTECSALSSIWISDEKTKEFYCNHNRLSCYNALAPKFPAYYDGIVEVDLNKIKPMIAMPFHPSNCYTIEEFRANAGDIINQVEEIAHKTMPNFSLSAQFYNDELHFTHATVAGCVGGLFENICEVNNILSMDEAVLPVGSSLHVYPASQSIYMNLLREGVTESLASKGVILMQASCGPCFGVQDIPANNMMVMRHITRNFLNREGARPEKSQSASVCLMDARSIAATLVNDGCLIGADRLDYEEESYTYSFDDSSYKKCVYNGYGKPDRSVTIVKGPNITDWPEFGPLPDHLLLKISGKYEGSVTTDELVPSGEASSYRSNPNKLALFTLINRDPEYIVKSKEILKFSNAYKVGEGTNVDKAFDECCKEVIRVIGCTSESLEVGSVILADKIGDGSAREQAASSQRVLGGRADIAIEFANKRFRSNLINWGLLPIEVSSMLSLSVGDIILLKDIRKTIISGDENLNAYHINFSGKMMERLALKLVALSEREREILLAGCLINEQKAIR